MVDLRTSIRPGERMLTPVRAHVARVLVAVVGAVIASTLVAASPAGAAGCPDGTVFVIGTGGDYGSCVPSTTTNPGTPTTGGPSEPQCDLSYNEGAYLGLSPDNSGNYCVGTKTCFNVAHYTPWKLPEGDKPKEDSEARIEFCFTSPFDTEMVRIYWTDDAEPPSLLEQSRTAIGQIRVPAPAVNLSPAGRTLVNLDTWFWAGGLPQQATGSSAFGLVAIAYDPRMTVDPGDGSGAFACPYVADAAAAEESCVHTYRRASLRGGASVDGRAAYGVEITTLYQLRFELNGNPVVIPGAQATFAGPPGTAAVRVDEIQTLSRPNR